ncbi:hypothetical protein [[Eubacterium] cellulosolvens]
MSTKFLGSIILLFFSITLVPLVTASSLIIKMEMEGIVVNALSEGDNTPIPSSLELYVASPSDDAHSYPYSIISGTLTVNNKEYEVDGIAYAHSHHRLSIMDLFRGYPFYKFKISATATDDENKIHPISIMGICNVSEVSFHGTFGRSIISMNGTIYDYSSGQLAPLWE